MDEKYNDLLYRLKDATDNEKLSNKSFSDVIDEIVPELKEYNNFKVGEWLIDTYGVKNPVCVKSIFGDYYELCSNDGYEYTKHIKDVNNLYRRWTIKDARDGDILVTEHGRPFIFKGLLDSDHPMAPVAHCGIDIMDEFCPSISAKHWWTDEICLPATKDQRDDLFARMKEERYSFNPDTKKLIKLDKSSIKICTSIDQSKKLIELGLDIKTADMFWDTLISKKPECHVDNHYLIDERDEHRIPAWSLSSLMTFFKNTSGIEKDYDLWYAYNNEKTSYRTKYYENQLDAAFELVCWFLVNNMKN